MQDRGTGGFRQGVCTFGKCIVPPLFLQSFRLIQSKFCIFCHSGKRGLPQNCGSAASSASGGDPDWVAGGCLEHVSGLEAN